MKSTQKSNPKMTISEKLAKVNNIYVSYPRFKEIINSFDYCHHFSGCKDEPECMFLSGQTGVGKTTIYRSYASRYPRKISDTGTIIPILAVTIPAPATVKTVVTKMLWELGDPAYEKGTIGNKTIRLMNLMGDCGVELIILDEFQHFIDRDSAKVLKTVSDWLKTLILDTNLPIILIGLPEAEEILRLRTMSQLSRRFANRCYLEPFVWPSDDGVEFRTFLHLLEQELPLQQSSDLADEEMARRFYYASDGVIAYVMKLIRYGTYLALQQNQESLSLDILAVAFAKYVQADKPEKVNPFLVENFQLSELSTSKMALTVGATNNRLGRKSKSPRASSVLKSK